MTTTTAQLPPSTEIDQRTTAESAARHVMTLPRDQQEAAIRQYAARYAGLVLQRAEAASDDVLTPRTVSQLAFRDDRQYWDVVLPAFYAMCATLLIGVGRDLPQAWGDEWAIPTAGK